jgi:hypothetical protein
MAPLGSVTAHLHISIGDGEPVDIATFEIPIAASEPIAHGFSLSTYVKPASLLALAGALRDVSQFIEEGTNHD